MSEIPETVTAEREGWTITEHSYHGVPFARATGPKRRYGDAYEVEFDGECIEVTVDATSEGYLYLQVPLWVMMELVSIHARRIAT